MDSAGGETIELAALGRPFNLGMLYDCRADKLIPGITLWDREELEQDMRELPKPNSEFEILASESISDKSSSLGVEASLKASFLFGLVEVEGSAKYMNDNKTSKKQARVTLQYKTTTQFKELTMNHLGRGNMKHPYIFEKGIATHVVTAILYGAQAFFVFDQDVSDTENYQQIQGSLKIAIKKIPLMSIEGHGAMNMEDSEKEKLNKFSCKFYGDFCLDQSPATFEDAVRVYQDLPKMLGPNGEKAVPVKVWLLPLTTLDSAAAKLVRQISLRLVLEAQSILEDFVHLEMRYNDILKNSASQLFPQISKKVKYFMALCSEFKLELQGTLAKKLPAIRGGGEEEADLAETLKERAESPFNSYSLNQWVDCTEREVYTLMSIVNLMTNTKVISENQLYQETFDTEKTVCFVFSSLGGSDPYLSALEGYLKGVQPEESEKSQRQLWYSHKHVYDTVRRKAKLFTEFAETNKDNINIKFLVIGLQDENHEASTVYIYEDGFKVRENFELPSKPNTVLVDIVTHNNVTLRFSAPDFGAESVTGYRVEHCVSDEEDWHQTEADVGEVTITDLSPNTEYCFRVRAVTDIGVGPASQVTDTIKTLPCGPPEELEVTAKFSEISVRWKRPTEVGEDVQIVRYIVDYGETEDDITMIEWKQEAFFSDEAVISEVDSLTPYTIKVMCDCGDNGMSRESVTVTMARPAERLIQTCDKISEDCEIPTTYKLPLNEEELGLSGCMRYVFGEESERENRSIILLGPRGSGKTTLINSIVNYILGIKWTNSLRFKLTDDSQTNDVTVYKINHQDGFRINYSLTIIDTPGFGDTRDMETDREITEQLLKLFTDEQGVNNMHAVCYVTPSAVESKTIQSYVFHSVLSILGKDLAEKIQILVTFADSHSPPVLGAFADAVVLCPETEGDLPAYCKFNNSALFAPNQTADEMEMFWDMGKASMKVFFDKLEQTVPQSLVVTSDVLKERKDIELSVEDLEEQVNAGLAMFKEIQENPEEPDERLIEEYAHRRDEVIELEKVVASGLERLKALALRPCPLQSPEYIQSLMEEEQSQAKPEWKKRVNTLQEMRIQAEIMDKVEKGESLLQE